MIGVILWIIFFFVAVAGGIYAYKLVAGPKITVEDGIVRLKMFSIPSTFEFYLRVVTSWNNLTKRPQLSRDGQIPPFEVLCIDGRPPAHRLPQFLKVCKYDSKSEDLPPSYIFGNSISLFGSVLSHPSYPLKSMAPITHMKQTISLIKPLCTHDRFSLRGIFQGGRITERGSDIDAVVEIYPSADFDAKGIIGQGVSSFLIIKKRGVPQAATNVELPPITNTTTFKVPANLGLQYAAASGDYNPWHINAVAAKAFGFKKAIAQGYWELARCIAEIGDRCPEYPLTIEAEWKRPLFLPSTVKMTERLSADRKTVFVELASEDGEHVHLIATIKNVPDLKLTATPLNRKK
eukprot:TRINITY_DN15011_c0_g1_i1.p1 TRINITY_DN15011_c0_g1~~TRINITY_DN15011_c0_g1_i1.p1  ORF type:complete len:348 (+),score=112.23 TRINITY_DN15011_c0_g1_i1:52-1095(+)